MQSSNMQQVFFYYVIVVSFYWRPPPPQSKIVIPHIIIFLIIIHLMRLRMLYLTVGEKAWDALIFSWHIALPLFLVLGCFWLLLDGIFGLLVVCVST
jgi:hypothetical protein